MNAIDYAMQFFENTKCNFHILNVQKMSEYISDDLISGSKTDTIYDSIAIDNKKAINQLVQTLSKKHKSQDYSFNGLFDYDDIVSAVDQAVKFHSIDLIIMGTNGASGAREVLFGSNTLQVIRSIDCPTLTIPEHFAFKGLKSALFSTQQCQNVSFEGIEVFKEMINIHQSKLNVLELDEDPIIMSQREDNKCIKTLFPEHPYTYYCINVYPGLVAVNTAIQLLKIDLHAVYVEKETFLERLFFGSDSSQWAYNALIPILFLHR
jgi:nucleotide-binding universal stress UspA family protein